MSDPRLDTPRLKAALALLERMGATQVQVRYCEEEQPVIWSAAASFKHPRGSSTWWQAAGALDPGTAVYRLLEATCDGGTCQHCGKTSGVDDGPPLSSVFEEMVCFYRFDPELATFRRGCEGVAP